MNARPSTHWPALAVPVRERDGRVRDGLAQAACPESFPGYPHRSYFKQLPQFIPRFDPAAHGEPPGRFILLAADGEQQQSTGVVHPAHSAVVGRVRLRSPLHSSQSRSLTVRTGSADRFAAPHDHPSAAVSRAGRTA